MKNKNGGVSSNLLISTQDLELLKLARETNYFTEKRIYNKGKLSGYAIIFLGYNSLLTNDISLERLIIDENDIKMTDYFIKEIVLSFPDKKFFCNDMSLQKSTYMILEKYGFQLVRSLESESFSRRR